jgi:hypothetical protein
MKRKGMLLASETLKIIIAVICIGFLVYLLGAIYFAKVADQQKIEAQKITAFMKDGFPKLNQTNPSLEMDGLTAKGWTIFSFSETEKKPDACAGQSCICVCDTVTFDVFDAQLKKCTDNNVCYMRPMLLDGKDIEINKDGSTNIQIYKKDNWYGVMQK